MKITTEEIPITSWLTKVDRIESKLQFGIILSGTQDSSVGLVKSHFFLVLLILLIFHERCSKLTSKEKLLTTKQASLFNEYRIVANVMHCTFLQHFSKLQLKKNDSLS